jgi:hypothetical protein
MHKHSTSDPNFQSVLQSDIVGSGTMKLTRTQQRQLDKLASYVERVSDTDRVFFEQHPDRKHRVRLASEVEIAELEITYGEVMTLPPGYRYFVIVRNVAPGHRVELVVENAEDARTDVPEEVARAIFDSFATPEVREIEDAVRAASKEGGAA